MDLNVIDKPHNHIITGGRETMQNPRLSAAALSQHYVSSFFGRARAARLMEEFSPGFGGASRADFWKMCLANLRENGDETHGITDQPLPASTWCLIYAMVNQMETVGEGLRKYAQLIQQMPTPVSISIGYGDTGLRLSYALTRGGEPWARGERYLEILALVFHCTLEWMAGHSLELREVRLSNLLDDADGSMLHGLAPVQKRYGNGVTLTYGYNDIMRPLGVHRLNICAFNATTRFLQRHALSSHADPVTTDISGKVKELLGRGFHDQQSIARRLAVSTATLRRRLAEEGTSFRTLSRETKRSKLLTLLETGTTLDEVAEELGLSDRRSLWRASQQWLGMSPTQYRQRS